jgi:hypothetical protein
MPSSSAKQHKFMEAVAHNPSFAKKVGVPQSVGKDFSNADKGKTFKRGGDMATKMDPKMMAMMMKKKSPAAPRAAAAPAAPMGMMKKGGMAKMATGGLAGGGVVRTTLTEFNSGEAWRGRDGLGGPCPCRPHLHLHGVQSV